MYSKVLTVAAVCVVCVLAAPPGDVIPLEKQQPTVIPIVSQSEELEANGTFKYSYETGNGIKREEEAYEKIVPKTEGRSASSDEGGESNEDSREIHVQRGSYSYTAPDGRIITVTYIADENGFQPFGDHIPRVPSAISNAPEKPSKPSDSSISASEPKEDKKPAPVLASAAVLAAKPEEPKEITTEKSEAAPEKPAAEESSSESSPNSTPSSAGATEAAAPTEASEEKQTTANLVPQSSQTSEPENASTTSSVPSSGEELGTTTAAS